MGTRVQKRVRAPPCVHGVDSNKAIRQKPCHTRHLFSAEPWASLRAQQMPAHPDILEGKQASNKQAEKQSLLTVALPQKTTRPGFVGRGLCTQETGWYWVPHRDAAFELLPRPRDRAPISPFQQV